MFQMFLIPSHADTLALAIAVAILYLAVIRFLDMNEKEPLWAIGLLFSLGAVAAVVLSLLVSSPTLELTVLPASFAEEAAKFVAIAGGVAALTAMGRLRGWSEISGLMDGLVYGAAAGLGFSTGQVFIQRLLFNQTFTPGFEPGPLSVLWTTALVGLADGIFGAIVGAGFGAKAQARSSIERVGYPIAGFLGAVLAHAGYLVLSRGNALGGPSALLRAWLALLFPLLFIVVVAGYAWIQERRTIRKELADEVQTGVVTQEEIAILLSVTTRQFLPLKALLRGDYRTWAGLRSLHNRQVQLALAKRRSVLARDEKHHAASETEVGHLRNSILEIKQALASASHSTDMEGAKT